MGQCEVEVAEFMPILSAHRHLVRHLTDELAVTERPKVIHCLRILEMDKVSQGSVGCGRRLGARRRSGVAGSAGFHRIKGWQS